MLLSSDSKESILWDCQDLSHVETWKPIFRIKDLFFPIRLYNRDLVAVIHRKKVKMWNSDLIREFNEDFETEEEQANHKSKHKKDCNK